MKGYSEKENHGVQYSLCLCILFSHQWFVCTTLYSLTKWYFIRNIWKYISSSFCCWKILPESVHGNINLNMMEKFWLYESSILQDNALTGQYVYFIFILLLVISKCQATWYDHIYLPFLNSSQLLPSFFSHATMHFIVIYKTRRTQT